MGELRNLESEHARRTRVLTQALGALTARIRGELINIPSGRPVPHDLAASLLLEIIGDHWNPDPVQSTIMPPEAGGLS